MWAYNFADLGVVVGAIIAGCCANDGGRMQLILWRTLAVWTIAYIPITTWFAIDDGVCARSHHNVNQPWLWVPIQVLSLAIILRPSWQQRPPRSVSQIADAALMRHVYV